MSIVIKDCDFNGGLDNSCVIFERFERASQLLIENIFAFEINNLLCRIIGEKILKKSIYNLFYQFSKLFVHNLKMN